MQLQVGKTMQSDSQVITQPTIRSKESLDNATLKSSNAIKTDNTITKSVQESVKTNKKQSQNNTLLTDEKMADMQSRIQEEKINQNNFGPNNMKFNVKEGNVQVKIMNNQGEVIRYIPTKDITSMVKEQYLNASGSNINFQV